MVFLILIPIILILFWFISIYNRLISLRNRREQAFSDIDVQLKQRNDLIPQLVEVVKGYTGHESQTLKDVINARNSNSSAHTISDKIQNDNQLTTALQGLKITVEAYPELKANQNFLNLHDEIGDIENKLAAVRRFFNATTKEYNTAVESFPNSFIASKYNFIKENLYELSTEKRVEMDEPPKINFN